MKILVLVSAARQPNNDVMYNLMRHYAKVEILKVDSKAQKNLGGLFKGIVVEDYDRIILDLYFKRIVNQARFIRTIPNLVIYEEDGCQNYIQESKWCGEFLKFYNKLGGFRLLCTSVRLAGRFRAEGIDAYFLGKGYDHSYLHNMGLSRDIELGFIGRVASQTYSKRKAVLEELEKKEGLQLIRTESGADYLRMLNRIRIFVSADIGLGEYMIKNFEAMACGCVVFAYRQGIEEKTMGLEDMNNIVLYRDLEELSEKLRALELDPARVLKIAYRGQQLAEARFSFEAVAKRFYELLEK